MAKEKDGGQRTYLFFFFFRVRVVAVIFFMRFLIASIVIFMRFCEGVVHYDRSPAFWERVEFRLFES